METARNIAGASLAALLFIGAWGANSNAIAAESNAAGAKGVLLKQEYAPGSYCHQKLSAIRESSLAGDHPVLSAEEKINLLSRDLRTLIGSLIDRDVVCFIGPAHNHPKVLSILRVEVCVRTRRD